MEELDKQLTLSDLGKLIDCFSCWKALRSDDIPPEVLNSRVAATHTHLSMLGTGIHPQEMSYISIVTLYKKKGDRIASINYRAISLLSVVGKAFARVALAR